MGKAPIWKPPPGVKVPKGVAGRIGRGTMSLKARLEYRRRKLEWKKIRARRNSGSFITIPDWELPDLLWERELEKRIARARVTMREIRDLYREGKDPPDPKIEAILFLEKKLGLGVTNCLTAGLPSHLFENGRCKRCDAAEGARS